MLAYARVCVGGRKADERMGWNEERRLLLSQVRLQKLKVAYLMRSANYLATQVILCKHPGSELGNTPLPLTDAHLRPRAGGCRDTMAPVTSGLGPKRCQSPAPPAPGERLDGDRMGFDGWIGVQGPPLGFRGVRWRASVSAAKKSSKTRPNL